MISDRALNRALLDRQLLLARVSRPALDVVEHLVGMQAQEPADPYVGLWTRLAGFDPGELAAAVASGAAVRLALQRSTIHLVTAADCVPLRTVLQPVLERQAHGMFRNRLGGADPAELVRLSRALVAESPMTFGELGRALRERWPGGDETALAQTARALVPMVQLPPRGVWGRSGRARHGVLDRPLGPDPAPDGLVLRYLAAFGPASVADVQNWSGLTRLAEVADRLRPSLRTLRAADGRELLDVPSGPLPAEDVPAPVRFLPQFDNVLLGHADRSRIVPPEARALYDEEFHWSPVLVDGLLRAVWRLDRRAGRLHVRAGRLSRAERAEVVAEGGALLGLLVPTAPDPDVVLSSG
ncbi:MAG TPA: winged helix DNA-binding domain-containing protein [Mycobacteriales bacterium]